MNDDEVRQAEIAAKLIDRHLARMEENWIEIVQLDATYPLLPTHKSWGTLMYMTTKMGAMIVQKENENGH